MGKEKKTPESAEKELPGLLVAERIRITKKGDIIYALFVFLFFSLLSLLFVEFLVYDDGEQYVFYILLAFFVSFGIFAALMSFRHDQDIIKADREIGLPALSMDIQAKVLYISDMYEGTSKIPFKDYRGAAADNSKWGKKRGLSYSYLKGYGSLTLFFEDSQGKKSIRLSYINHPELALESLNEITSGENK
jgi:hypothetical protein